MQYYRDIVDAVFNLPPRHAREVSEALIARGLNTPWTCYLNPLYFDQALANVMARAACSGVEIGSDSGTDEGLERLRKGFSGLVDAVIVKSCEHDVISVSGLFVVNV